MGLTKKIFMCLKIRSQCSVLFFHLMSPFSGVGWPKRHVHIRCTSPFPLGSPFGGILTRNSPFCGGHCVSVAPSLYILTLV